MQTNFQFFSGFLFAFSNTAGADTICAKQAFVFTWKAE